MEPRDYVHVIACAGSGKTSMLVRTVEGLIVQGMDPGRVRVFSYTHAAENEVRERLRAAGVPEGVRVTTLHGFAGMAANAIRETGIELPHEFGASRSTVITDVVRAAETELEAAAALQHVADCDFFCVDEAQDNDDGKHGLCRTLLELSPDLGAMVVGDPNQSIFGFTGAAPLGFENFFDFSSRPVGTVRMVANYRCPLGVIVAANAVLRRIGCMRALNIRSAALDELSDSARQGALDRAISEGLYAPMEAGRAPCGGVCAGCAVCDAATRATRPRVTSHRSVRAEVAWVVGQIRELVASGVAPRQIAVLHRTNGGLMPYFTLVSSYGINAVIAGEADLGGEDHVSLRTVHSSKGAEFDHVFMIGVSDAYFPLILSHELVGDWVGRELEELRLLYVGMTRARRALSISFISTRDSKLTRFLGHEQLETCLHSLTRACMPCPDEDPDDTLPQDEVPSVINLRMDKLVGDVGEETFSAWAASPQPSEADVTLCDALAGVRVTQLFEATDPLRHPACIERLNGVPFHARFVQSLVTTCLCLVRGVAPKLGRDVVAQLLAASVSAPSMRALQTADGPTLRGIMQRPDVLVAVAAQHRRRLPGGAPPAVEGLHRPPRALLEALGEYSEAAVAVFCDATGRSEADLGSPFAYSYVTTWLRALWALRGEASLDDLCRRTDHWDKASIVPRVAREVRTARRMLVGLHTSPPSLDDPLRLTIAVMQPVAASRSDMLHRLAACGDGSFDPVGNYWADPDARALVSDVIEQCSRLGALTRQLALEVHAPALRELPGTPPVCIHGECDLVLGGDSAVAISAGPTVGSEAWARLVGYAGLRPGIKRVVFYDVFQRTLHSIDLTGWTGTEEFIKALCAANS
jgi:hypothetical protein